MNTDRSCGCKSFRTCFVCEAEHGLVRRDKPEGRMAELGRVLEYDPETGTLKEKDGKETGL